MSEVGETKDGQNDVSILYVNIHTGSVDCSAIILHLIVNIRL